MKQYPGGTVGNGARDSLKDSNPFASVQIREQCPGCWSSPNTLVITGPVRGVIWGSFVLSKREKTISHFLQVGACTEAGTAGRQLPDGFARERVPALPLQKSVSCKIKNRFLFKLLAPDFSAGCFYSRVCKAVTITVTPRLGPAISRLLSPGLQKKACSYKPHSSQGAGASNLWKATTTTKKKPTRKEKKKKEAPANGKTLKSTF